MKKKELKQKLEAALEEIKRLTMLIRRQNAEFGIGKEGGENNPNMEH